MPFSKAQELIEIATPSANLHVVAIVEKGKPAIALYLSNTKDAEESFALVKQVLTDSVLTILNVDADKVPGAPAGAEKKSGIVKFEPAHSGSVGKIVSEVHASMEQLATYDSEITEGFRKFGEASVASAVEEKIKAFYAQQLGASGRIKEMGFFPVDPKEPPERDKGDDDGAAPVLVPKNGPKVPPPIVSYATREEPANKRPTRVSSNPPHPMEGEKNPMKR